MLWIRTFSRQVPELSLGLNFLCDVWMNPLFFLQKTGIGLLFCCSLLQANAQDSVITAIAPAYDSVSGLHRFLFGEGYRKVWAVPVRLRVVHLSHEKGGLQVVQKGGGNQTKSLRLKDAGGREWSLRSIQKFPERGLPPDLKETIARDILQDQVMTSHPFAALVVPRLAKAAGIPHTVPEIIFLADDPGLGDHRADFANTPLLLEPRVPPGTGKSENTEKLQEALESDGDARVDQQLLLRARLFDHFLGDWDRHEDQWRWEKVSEGGETVYKPLPRDRDKVFYTTSGLFPGVLSGQLGRAQLQPFRGTIKSIGRYNFNNRYFDRYFLNGLEEKDWEEAIRFLQAALTDEVIHRAMQDLPDTVYALTGKKLEKTLIARRNSMKEWAMAYYRFLSRTVDIPATGGRELFEIEPAAGGALEVTIRKGEGGTVLYRRRFLPEVTDEVRLFGLGGADRFRIGTGASPIRLHLVGGAGNDTFDLDASRYNRRRLYIWDHPGEANRLPSSRLARLRLSADSAHNAFDRKSFAYDRVGPRFSVQYNLDLGLMLAAGLVYERQGFRKEPYARRHSIYSAYSPSRGSFLIQYHGDLRQLMGRYDLLLNLVSRGPGYMGNFFGIGNETDFVDDGDKLISYYRNRYYHLDTDVRIGRGLGRKWRATLGLGLQYFTAPQGSNAGRYLADYNLQHKEARVFNKHLYTGLVGGLTWDRRPEAVLPAKGLFFELDWMAMKEVKGASGSFGKLKSELVFYLPLFSSSFILANRLGGGTTVGNPLFFQQFGLGGPLNLRGYHINRFTGHSAFYHNAELRVKLFDFHSYLFPGSVGLLGFHDIGRVWAKGETSDAWHHAIGGGLFVIPAQVVLLQAAIARSPEGVQPYFSLGVSF